MKFKLKDFLTSLLFLGGFLGLYKLLESVIPPGKWSFLIPLTLLAVALAAIVWISHLMKKRE
jgi:hypothetical protein